VFIRYLIFALNFVGRYCHSHFPDGEPEAESWREGGDKIHGAGTILSQRQIFAFHSHLSRQREVATCPKVLGDQQSIFPYQISLVVNNEGSEGYMSPSVCSLVAVETAVIFKLMMISAGEMSRRSGCTR
jgi:hypothetical protein